MSWKNSLSLFLLIAAAALSAAAQTAPKKTALPQPTPAASSSAVKSSPAYAEILLRRTELFSDLEALLIDYTEDFPKVKQLRHENELLTKELERLLAVNPAETGKLTLALGKLMVRRAELETDLWSLRQQFNDEHPDVKRARRKAEIYETAIREIMPGK
jgi:hypothetical protein